ncbi:MAG: TRAP transporter substrate-binding protein DctP [Chloroflexi bacterium]|nr:TRAP transporter substrate-binding protein DctP [Chloroflexota bacterium]
MRRELFILVAALFPLVVLVNACTSPSAAPTPTSAPKPSSASAPAPAPSTAAKPTPITLVFSDQGNGMRSMLEPIVWWADEVSKRTGVPVKIDFHYGGTLAPAKEVPDGLRAGLFDMSWFSVSLDPAKMPLHEVSALPNSSGGPGDMAKAYMKVMNMPEAADEYKKWNSVPLFAIGQPSHEIISRVPIKTANDLKGKKIRVVGIQGKVLQAMGATPTQIPGPEMYEALARGTVDGVLTGFAYAWVEYKLHEAGKYGWIGGFGAHTNPVMMSLKKWNTLDPAVQKAMIEVANETPVQVGRSDRDTALGYLEEVLKAGVQITYASKEDAALVQKLTGPVQDGWAQGLEAKGLPAKKVLDVMRKSLSGN